MKTRTVEWVMFDMWYGAVGSPITRATSRFLFRVTCNVVDTAVKNAINDAVMRAERWDLYDDDLTFPPDWDEWGSGGRSFLLHIV